MNKRKVKPIIKRIFEPLYRFELLFICGNTLTEANKVIKKFNLLPPPHCDDDTNGFLASYTEKDCPQGVKGVIYVLWVEDRKDFYCLVHEVSHLVVSVFVDKGIEINGNTQEPFAYYQEFWIKKLWNLIS